MADPVLPTETGDRDPELPQLGGGRTSIALFALIAVLMATDLSIEYRINNEPLGLQGFELCIFVLALGGFAFHWRQMVTARRRSQQLDRALAEARAEVTRWSADAKRWNQEAQDVLQGLGQAIDRQFDRWALSPAEREVALLQLKGLRHRAIAELRHTSERTVRQQALAVYRKSGLSGRSDLAAFFLEDLLLPASTSSDVRQSVS
jgi:DNA-binding CsgD family transcriptional regulator